MVSWRYKGPPLGWGTATFRTPEARNNFLKDRPKHRLGSKIVDVKEYYWEERPEPGTVPAPAPVPKPAPVPVPIPREPFTPQWKSTSLDQALQNCQTGKIARYVVYHMFSNATTYVTLSIKFSPPINCSAKIAEFVNLFKVRYCNIR